MKRMTVLFAVVAMTACTQTQTPPAEVSAADSKAQTVPTQAVSGTEVTAPATTPILSLLVGPRITPAARGTWCLKEGTPPFTKISIQDESIAAPIESQSAPIPGTSTSKDTGTQQAPGTARITGQRGDSIFTIQWLRSGIKGDAQIVVQGDGLNFVDEAGTATFQRCN